MYKVLVTSKSFAKYNPEIIDELQHKGIQLVRCKRSNLNSQEIAQEIKGYDGIVCGIDKINKQVMEAEDKLKIIHMNGTGIDHIDIEEASKRGIYVGNCPGANAGAVAELNLGILLAEARKIVKHSNVIHEGRWEREVGVELSGKTMGVLGLGAIGRRFVELLKGFEMKILAYDVQPDTVWCGKNGVEIVEDVKRLYQESDFISLNLPLFDSTKNIIDKDSISLMKQDVIIVNTARGGLIKTTDLIEALGDNRIRGAALDAFEREPLDAESELRNLNITLTPHIGASSIESMKKTTRLVAEHLEEVLLHKDARHMVNKEEVSRYHTKKTMQEEDKKL